MVLAVTPGGGLPLWMFLPAAVIIVGLIVFKRMR
jgi:hypothetical protein